MYIMYVYKIIYSKNNLVLKPVTNISCKLKINKVYVPEIAYRMKL